MSENADYGAPLFVHPNGVIQCGWCLQTVLAHWAASHREMHVESLSNLSELPQFDGT